MFRVCQSVFGSTVAKADQTRASLERQALVSSPDAFTASASGGGGGVDEEGWRGK